MYFFMGKPSFSIKIVHGRGSCGRRQPGADLCVVTLADGFRDGKPEPKTAALGARRIGAVESVEKTVCGERSHSGITVGKLQQRMFAAGKL